MNKNSFIAFFSLNFLLVRSEVQVWGQCGGRNYNGETSCESLSNCIVINEWYSQCQPKPNDPSRVNEWNQCGGLSYNGNTLCQTWLTCVKLNDWYSQCLKTFSTTKTPSTITSTRKTSTTKTSSITTNSLNTSTTTFRTRTFSSSTHNDQCNPVFQSDQLKIGISYDWTINNNVNYNNFDYISIWLAYSDDLGTNFNQWFHGPMIDTALANNKSVVFYMYLIAFQARYDLGIKDCDVDYHYNLCVYGAQFIRDNRQLLVSRYEYHARWIAQRYGRDKRVIFAIEPDFVQYYSDNRQIGGRLSGQYMRELFDDFVLVLKSELPNCLISWDISPWLGIEGMRIWWRFFETSQIDFIHTSGGSVIFVYF